MEKNDCVVDVKQDESSKIDEKNEKKNNLEYMLDLINNILTNIFLYIDDLYSLCSDFYYYILEKEKEE
jgi:hypothetical protein